VEQSSALSCDCSAVQEVSCFLWNLTVCFCIEKSPLAVLMLSQMNSIHIPTPDLFMKYFSIIIQRGLLDLGFPSKTKSKFIVLSILIFVFLVSSRWEGKGL
jgi:hypothetical protein